MRPMISPKARNMWRVQGSGVRSQESPDFRCSQFKAVAGGVAEIETPAAARPVDRFLNGHAVLRQPLNPGRQLGLADGERDVTGAEGAVRRKVVRRFAALQRVKQQHHLLAAAKED